MTALGSRVMMGHRCSILRNTGAANTWGGKDASYVAIKTGVPCLAWNAANASLITPAEDVPVATYHVALPLGTDVTDNDRIGPVTCRGSVVLPGPAYRIANLTRWPDRIELVLRVDG